ncbi:MAG: DUF6477 family protein [Pseudomonadota bacterium]
MQDVYTRLSTLKRPRLLVSAARHGLAEYDRCRHLSKVLGTTRAPGSAEAAMRLMELEASHNEARVTGDGAYAVGRHVDVLIALMGEAALLAAARAAPV